MNLSAITTCANRTQWFQEARFGMFIHWGLYAIPARGVMVRSAEQMTEESYLQYFREFSAIHYKPHEWAKLAKSAGMQYAVFTAKHHDGFCLFDSALTDYKSINTPCKRDLVAEFLDAFRSEGIRVGLYYSLLDWHHPDYPHYGDEVHPLRSDPSAKNDSRMFSRYLEYMHGQVRELLTNYGKLDIMWFDYSYGDMEGETWKSTQLIEMVRSLQPNIIIDNRLEKIDENSGSIFTSSPSAYAGDFVSPEQIIPPVCICDIAGNPIPWESCITLNRHWGYTLGDTHYKSASMIIRMLTECVSKNGNLLLNIGPDAAGRIPDEAQHILQEVGNWMNKNGTSIYGCGMSKFPKPECGRLTQKGENILYVHIFEEQTGPICLPGLAGKIERIRLLMDGSELPEFSHWYISKYGENAYFFLNPSSYDSYPLPNCIDTVVEIILKN